jgi:RNase P/RNase MRP subunit p29
MIIIWRGLGWIVPAIFVAGFIILSNIIPDSLHEWKLAIVIAIPSLIIGIIGYIVNYKKRRIIINEETGEEEKIPSHSFFLIPIEVWAIIIPIVFILTALS